MAENLSPWFANGLRFACTQCGACCTGVPGYVWVSRDEIRQIAEALDLSVNEFRQRFTQTVSNGKRALREKPNGDCIFFDRRTRRCTIYPVRPVQCRTWPFWPSNVRSPQAWVETCQVCPGAGTGRLFHCEEIQDAAAQADP